MKLNRRRFLTSAAAGGTMLVVSSAGTSGEAQLVYRKADWDIAGFEQLVRNPAHVKQVYDIVQVGEGKFLNNLKNSLNGLHYGFGIAQTNVKVISALHGPANLLAYDDAMWAKYQLGAFLKVMDPASSAPATRNPFYASKHGNEFIYPSQDPDHPDSLYQDTSIMALQHRVECPA